MYGKVQHVHKQSAEGQFEIDLEAIKPHAHSKRVVMPDVVDRVAARFMEEHSRVVVSLVNKNRTRSDSRYSTLVVKPTPEANADPMFAEGVTTCAARILAEELGAVPVR